MPDGTPSHALPVGSYNKRPVPLIRSRRRKFAPGVTVSDWTATARCPHCDHHQATYRMAPDREGFYTVACVSGRNPEELIGIIKTQVLAKAICIEAAIYAAMLCDRCERSVFATGKLP